MACFVSNLRSSETNAKRGADHDKVHPNTGVCALFNYFRCRSGVSDGAIDETERANLLGDVPALFLVAAILWYLMPAQVEALEHLRV